MKLASRTRIRSWGMIPMILSWMVLWYSDTTIAEDAVTSPADWPRWRGDAGAGAGGTQRFPHQWTEKDWAWTVRLPGQGHASPVVWRQRIYTASADEAAAKRFVSCHATTDGRLLWQREIPGPIEPHHAQNSSASGSVTVDGVGVYWL